MITSFSDFCAALRQAGFSMGGPESEGVFSLCAAFAPSIQWHTEDPETDPWAWRIRGVTECRDLAYGKLFLRKGGWITRPWMPAFIAARRAGKDLEALYEDGLISRTARDIYQAVSQSPGVPLHELKQQCGQGVKPSSFESALTALQMNLFVVINGNTRKLSQMGLPYGWPVNTYCTVEQFFGESCEQEARELAPAEAVSRIRAQILALNPEATDKAVARFIAAAKA